MKKFARLSVVLVLAVVVVGVLAYYMPKSFGSFCDDFAADATVAIYCRQTSLASIDVGSGKIVQCASSDLTYALACCSGVDGISVSFGGSADDVARLVSFFRLVDATVTNFDDLTVVCGSSSKIAGGVFIDGQFVNLQIALHGGTVTVGSPLILGSY